MLALKTASKRNIRPCTFLFENESPNEWCVADSNLLMALELLDSERCPECGEYVWICRDTSPFCYRFGYTAESSMCLKSNAQRVVQDRFDKRGEESKETDTEKSRREGKYGIVVNVRAVLKEGEKMPTRKEYYEWMKDKHFEYGQYEDSDEYWDKYAAT